MVTGAVEGERLALNHDLLWRRFLSYPDKRTAVLLPDVRRLCLEGKWDDAQNLFLSRIPETGHALYINPFVPFCDLGLFIRHKDGAVQDYTRILDMDSGVVSVTYAVGSRRYRRDYFCSYPEGLLLIRLTCSAMGCLSGEVSLSRLLDPDCLVTGHSGLGSVVLEGLFEEGVSFAGKVRIYQQGGRLTGGIKAYVPPAGTMPASDISGITTDFRDESAAFEPCGLSTRFDSADEVLIAVALATDDETDRSPLDCCDRKLARLGDRYPDIDGLIETHRADHRQLYRRSGLHLAGGDAGETVEALLARVAEGEPPDSSLYSRLYHMGRYLSIASGRPQPQGTAPKSPINLQGMWNQDRRPAWDCDLHLDLNLEMCYWGQDAANLGELMQPLMDWVTRLLPQACHSAMDVHGCRGAYLGATCDNKTVGNIDNIGYCFTSAAAWIAQLLWLHYEYAQDLTFLEKDLYPFLKELGAFYDDFLIKDQQGRLVTCPSCSPEMGIAGRNPWSVLSSAASIDLELIREVYSHLIEASRRLGTDAGRVADWNNVLDLLPLPVRSTEHGLSEWLEPHEPYDAGHRHRSHLVGIVPGDRITPEDTPDDAAAVRKALTWRNKNGMGSSLSFSTVTDAMIYARLYDAREALNQLNLTIYHNVMDNLLMALCDWRNRGDTLAWFGGHKVFQIEAGLGLSCSIAEMIVQDRRGIIRLLPALPDSWPDGRAYGLCTRGGFETELQWQSGRLVSAIIHSRLGGQCRVMAFGLDGGIDISSGGVPIHFEDKDGVVSFDTTPGKSYSIVPAPAM
jgi:alpha-L-fucosidase 2